MHHAAVHVGEPKVAALVGIRQPQVVDAQQVHDRGVEVVHVHLLVRRDDFERFVARKDKTGRVWGAHEKLTRLEALRIFTQGGANYMLRGDKFG